MVLVFICNLISYQSPSTLYKLASFQPHLFSFYSSNMPSLFWPQGLLLVLFLCTKLFTQSLDKVVFCSSFQWAFLTIQQSMPNPLLSYWRFIGFAEVSVSEIIQFKKISYLFSFSLSPTVWTFHLTASLWKYNQVEEHIFQNVYPFSTFKV